jgi:hypothetical protein
VSNCVQKAEGIVGTGKCHVLLRKNCFYICYAHLLNLKYIRCFWYVMEGGWSAACQSDSNFFFHFAGVWL